MPWEERAEILMAIKGVTDVVQVDDSDGTVCEALRRIRPDYFANGGDRKVGNTPEGDVCAELGIEMLWGVGGTDKVQSSSWLIDAVRKS
jgi:glycerol-3-phosphate cytidylyltransferase-like family protein